jgi:diaminohydroxyphosphoribosylaminopyrimidine deaminase/5-amino-6-(5-phosphoribosylamino)uracil reductase
MNNAELFASQPLRVIVDSQMRTHGTAKILSEPGLVKIFCNEDMNVKNNFANNVEIIQSISDSQGVNLNFMLEYLASKFTCNDVLIEAGPTLSGSFIRAGLVDELVVYIAPKLLGSDAKPLFEITGLESLVESTQFVTSEVTQIGTDIKAMLIRS